MNIYVDIDGTLLDNSHDSTFTTLINEFGLTKALKKYNTIYKENTKRAGYM